MRKASRSHKGNPPPEIIREDGVNLATSGNIRLASLTLSIDPRDMPTAQQKGAQIVRGKFGKPFIHFYTKGKVERWKRAVADSLRALERVRRHIYDSLAFSVEIHFFFGYPKSCPKRDAVGSHPMTCRPDVDNLAKGLIDAITDAHIAWDDDASIYSMKITKTLTDTKPRVVVDIYGE